MTREEAIQALKDLADMNVRYGCDDKWITALHMAIEALKADALLKQEIDFHKEVSRIEAEKVVDLEHKLADMVSVVRCKDCLHHGMRDCPVWGDDTTEDYMWCYYGERSEK